MVKGKGKGGGRRDSALVDERAIDRWVSELRRMVVGGQVELYARVGEYFIEHVYKGVDEATSRRPSKSVTLVRLAERAEEFGMTASAVKYAVPFALQVRELGMPLAERLRVRQHHALFVVKDPSEKRLLAEAAVASQWDVKELVERVRQLQGKHEGGRPPEPAIVVLLRGIERQFAEVKIARYKSDLPKLSRGDVRRLLGRVNAAQETLEKLEKLLTRAALR